MGDEECGLGDHRAKDDEMDIRVIYTLNKMYFSFSKLGGWID